MSEENVELVRRAAEALNRRDHATWLTVNAADLELVPLSDWPESGLQGAEAAWNFYLSAFDAFEPFAVDNAEFIDAGGDKVLLHYRTDVSGKRSGAAVAFDVSAVLTVREGKVRRIHWFANRAEALEAAGLSE